jgi:hypothetical protein
VGSLSSIVRALAAALCIGSGATPALADGDRAGATVASPPVAVSVGRVGGGRASSSEPIAGGFGNPLRVPITVVPPGRGTRLGWHPGGPARLLWTGFEGRAEGGRVVLQVSADVSLEARPSPHKDGALFVLRRVRVLRANDKLPLETRYFDSTPVTRVELRRRGADLEIAVKLRRPAQASLRKEPGPGGSFFWMIEFPIETVAAQKATPPASPTASR